MKIFPDHSLLQYSGRIDFDDPSAPVLEFAASYVKMRFSGTRLAAFIVNKHAFWSNYLGVIIDGKQTKIKLDIDSLTHEYVLAEEMDDTIHEVILFKRQDGCHMITFLGFEINNEGKIYELEPKPNRRIEVFGDSVSCGEVSEAISYIGKEDPAHDGEYSNSWYSYAWMTARMLHAELHDTSQGGIALLDYTGWFVAPDFVGMESCFDKLLYQPELSKLKQWNFENYQPHIVIIALGQNDSHPNDYMAENYDSQESITWRIRYQEFVQTLMELYPKAQFILQTTLLEHNENWDRAIDEVCNKVNSQRVHHYLYQRNGAGTPGHLRIPEAEEMAIELSAYINSLGDDIWAD